MNQTCQAAVRQLAFAAMLACAAAGVQAQANLDKLKQMKVATTDLNIPLVPQTGKNADAIRANLTRVKLPPGFKIDLYAVVPDARHMAVAPSTNMFCSSVPARQRSGPSPTATAATWPPRSSRSRRA